MKEDYTYEQEKTNRFLTFPYGCLALPRHIPRKLCTNGDDKKRDSSLRSERQGTYWGRGRKKDGEAVFFPPPYPAKNCLSERSEESQ